MGNQTIAGVLVGAVIAVGIALLTLKVIDIKPQPVDQRASCFETEKPEKGDYEIQVGTETKDGKTFVVVRPDRCSVAAGSTLTWRSDAASKSLAITFVTADTPNSCTTPTLGESPDKAGGKKFEAGKINDVVQPITITIKDSPTVNFYFCASTNGYETTDPAIIIKPTAQ